MGKPKPLNEYKQLEQSTAGLSRLAKSVKRSHRQK
jgi:hypothetical protein